MEKQTLTDLVILKRPLLSPRAEELYPLYRDMIAALGRTGLPAGVRYVDPKEQGINIVGATVITSCFDNANGGSPIKHMTPADISWRVRQNLPPSAWDPLVVRTFAHRIVSNAGTRPMTTFGTYLGDGAVAEHNAAVAAVRDLAGFAPRRGREFESNLPWSQSRSGFDEPLATELLAIAAEHLPAGAELVFGPVREYDTVSRPSFFASQADLLGRINAAG